MFESIDFRKKVYSEKATQSSQHTTPNLFIQVQNSINCGFFDHPSFKFLIMLMVFIGIAYMILLSNNIEINLRTRKPIEF